MHQSGVIRGTQSTEDIIAKQFGVGNGTVQRAKQFVDSIDAAEKVSPGGDRRSDEFSSGQNVLLNRREVKDGTAGRIGKEYGVDGRTIRRDADFSNAVDSAEELLPGFKESILSGSVKAPKSVIAEIRNIPEEKRPAAVEAIKSGDIAGAKEIIKKL